MRTKNKKKNRIFQWESFTNVQKLIILTCCLLFLILIVSIWNMVNSNGSIDYQKANYDTFIADHEVTNDRQVYWALNDIIANYINSYRFTDSSDLIGDYTTSDYYLVLTKAYQNHLKESKYKEVSQSFIQKFVKSGEEEISLMTSRMIQTIYTMGNNQYFCELNGFEEKKAYIGIELNPKLNTFKIFYIE